MFFVVTLLPVVFKDYFIHSLSKLNPYTLLGIHWACCICLNTILSCRKCESAMVRVKVNILSAKRSKLMKLANSQFHQVTSTRKEGGKHLGGPHVLLWLWPIWNMWDQEPHQPRSLSAPVEEACRVTSLHWNVGEEVMPSYLLVHVSC